MLVMHHHLYKAAGTTVDWILQKNFPDRVLHVEGETPEKRLLPAVLRQVAARNPGAVCMASHSAPLPANEETWADLHLILLREPLARLYSMYRFAWSHPSAFEPDAVFARRHSFGEYCDWWLEQGNSGFTDWQTRCCTPQSETTLRNSEFGEADIDAALACITDVVWVGTVELFNESMVLLESRLAELGHELDAAYLRQNVGIGRAAGSGERDRLQALMGKAAYDRFHEANALDVALHGRATELVRTRFQALADSGERLLGFRERCARLADSAIRAEVRVPGPDSWHRVAGSAEADGEGAAAARAH